MQITVQQDPALNNVKVTMSNLKSKITRHMQKQEEKPEEKLVNRNRSRNDRDDGINRQGF